MALLRVPTRRSFLQSSIRAVATVAASSGLARQGSAQDGRARWAFLSDTHIPEDPNDAYRGFRPHVNLARVATLVAKANVSGTVVDGDLARLLGLPGDYAAFKKLLTPVLERMPVAMSLGNHDHRANFAEAFAEHPGEEQAIRNKHVLVVPAGPVRLVILDSLLQANLTPGLLGKEQRVWLEQFLPSLGSTPVIVFVHHTPGDRDTDLLDTDKLISILSSNRNVKALVYGHSHSYAFNRVKDLHLINLPAVGYNFEDDEPVGWTEVELSREGADFTLHTIGGNQSRDGEMTSVSWRG